MNALKFLLAIDFNVTVTFLLRVLESMPFHGIHIQIMVYDLEDYNSPPPRPTHILATPPHVFERRYIDDKPHQHTNFKDSFQ